MAATDAPATPRQSAIGVSTPRRDSEPKVRGVTRFAADIPVNDLLHARLLLSHDAHALIKSIDTTAARELPGVVAVLTAEDLPIVATGSGRSKNPLAREEIMYAGQPIAIAVGETEAIAADAIELIELELEPVEAVVDVEGAVLPRAPRARLHTVDEDVEVELGADREGNFTGIRTRIWCDRGSTDSMGVESIAAMLSAGPYRWQAHHLTCYGVMTNRVTFGAYRAPTAPPAAFAVESLIDELAGRLEIDPLELRLRNVLIAGDKTVAGQEMPVFGALECLERMRDQPMWTGRHSLPEDEGVGLSIGWWPGGYEPAGGAWRLASHRYLPGTTRRSEMTGVHTPS